MSDDVIKVRFQDGTDYLYDAVSTRVDAAGVWYRFDDESSILIPWHRIHSVKVPW